MSEGTLNALNIADYNDILKEVIAEVSTMELETSQEGLKPLTVAVMMRGVNKKKDYSK
jgi:hypothetical protein